AKKLVKSAAATAVEREVRSESVRATSVTLRSTATPLENSTVPKNSTNIIGTTTANSVAAMPRQSATRAAADRRVRNQIDDIGLFFIARLMNKPGLRPGRARS